MMNFIFGSGGCAREVDWLIDDIFRVAKIDYRPHFFVVEDSNPQIGKAKNVISESIFFEQYANKDIRCFIGIGNPKLKKKIHDKIHQVTKTVKFPNLIHPTACFDKRRNKIKMGLGNIICSNSVLTTDIELSDFVTLNYNCTVGHDCLIGSYTTISPGVNLSGKVEVEEAVFLGANASVIEGVKIAKGSVVGAGATVVDDLKASGTYVGTPARQIK